MNLMFMNYFKFFKSAIIQNYSFAEFTEDTYKYLNKFASDEFTLKNEHQIIKSEHCNQHSYNKKRLWKDYINEDDCTMDDVINEMYKKYKCENVYDNKDTIISLNNFYMVQNKDHLANMWELNNLFFNISKHQICLSEQKKSIYDLDKYYYKLCEILNKIKFKKEDFFESNYNNLFKQFVMSQNFLHIFMIIEQDIINTIKNAIIFSKLKTNYLHNFINKIKINLTCKEKIIILIIILKELLELDLTNQFFINNVQENKIKDTLRTCKTKSLINYQIQVKLSNKLKSIRFHLSNRDFLINEFFCYGIKIINNITDKEMLMLCLLGFNKLFEIDQEYSTPRFLRVFTILYAFNYEKNEYCIDWNETLISLLLKYSIKDKIFKILPKLFKNLFSEKNDKKAYGLYVCLNSKSLFKSLECYEEIQKDKKCVSFIHSLIDLVNLTKIKLFGINVSKDNFLL